jgi:hypothetical protein
MAFIFRILKRRLLMGNRMRLRPIQEKHYGEVVWVNLTTERLRQDECLCLNCGKLKPGQPDNCQRAQAFYEICVQANIAIIITRCRDWDEKKKNPQENLSDVEKAKLLKMEETIP